MLHYTPTCIYKSYYIPIRLHTLNRPTGITFLNTFNTYQLLQIIPIAIQFIPISSRLNACNKLFHVYN